MTDNVEPGETGPDGTGPDRAPELHPEIVVRPPSDPTGQVFVVEDESAGPEEADGEAPQGSVLRKATVVSGRIILGFVVLAVIALVVGAAGLVPLPSVRAGQVSSVVTPVPTQQQLVCPGGLLRLGTASGADATSASPIGSPRISSGALPGDVLSSVFANADAGNGGSTSAPHLLSTPPAAGTGTALLGGAQSESVSTDDFAGLSSAACTAASGETWLAGGATATGRTTLLLLANPTDVASVVTLHIFGEAGPVTAPGMDGITVAARSQRVLSIAGFAPGLASPVVHVTSTGGQIVASLEQSTVRGVTPGGIDFIGGQAQPGTTAVIPGVVVSGTSALQSDIGASGYEDLQSTLRLFAPGTRAAKVTITILNEDGTVTGKPTSASVPAGDVNDLALDSLSDGSYTIVVTSKVPIVASVRVSTAGSASAPSGTTDFAWATAAPLLDAGSIVTVAGGMTGTVHLENPTGSVQTVELTALDGTSLSATVQPHSATSVPVQAGASYELEGFSTIYASVSGSTDGGVTSYAVYPSAHGAGPLRIYD